MINLPKVSDVRAYFIDALANKQFVKDKSGVDVIELIGTSFIADEPFIFGKPNLDYIERELEWYKSRSLNVNDIPGGPPTIWKSVASASGEINSNYGWCIWDDDNCNQYTNVRNELYHQPGSRRAIMVYNRPSMHNDYNRDGMSDFMCTNAVQYLIRDKRLHAIVNMRSNDVVHGFRNDYAWQAHVQKMLLDDLNMNWSHDSSRNLEASLQLGDIIWNAGSLHVYARHFHLVK